MMPAASRSASPRGFSRETTAEGALVARYRHPDAALALVGLPFAVLVIGWMGWTVGQAMVDVMRTTPGQAALGVGTVVALAAVGVGYLLLGVAFNTTELRASGTGEAPNVLVRVRPFPRGPSRRVAGVALERVVVRTREDVTETGGIRGGGGGKIRRTTHHDLHLDTAAGHSVRLLSDTNAEAVDAFARALADRLGRPLVHAM